MGTFNLILIAIAVSLDGFWGGFAFGLRKIKIPLGSLIFISFWSILCTFIAMLVGYYLKAFIPIEMAKYIGAVLLLLLALYTLKEGYEHQKEQRGSSKLKLNLHNLVKILQNPILADYDNQNDIKPMEGTMLGLAVAMDASIAAFTIALVGVSPYTTPFLFGLAHFLLIGSGNLVARTNIINSFGEKFSLLPGFILLILAVLRFI
ncbi:MAG: putative rane protein [Clostridia bacterium]|jgi:putative sporulation protein YtaF|nr:putative rane protein [Clostridia bacterium]